MPPMHFICGRDETRLWVVFKPLRRVRVLTLLRRTRSGDFFAKESVGVRARRGRK